MSTRENIIAELNQEFTQYAQYPECHSYLQPEYFLVQLLLEVQELGKCQFAVEFSTKEVAGKSGTHLLQRVARDGVISVTHAHTGLRVQDPSHLLYKYSIVNPITCIVNPITYKEAQ